MRHVLAIALTIVAFVEPLSAARNSARVYVDVSAGNNSVLRERVRSYIERELRQLGDVDVVASADDADYSIFVIAAPPVLTVPDIPQVVILSIAVVLHAKCNERKVDIFEYPELRQTTDDNLPAICSDLVVRFDTQIMRAQRQTWQHNH